MKIEQLKKYGLFITVPLVLSACVDDSYDLTDLDTTSEFQVKDLVLPMNLDEIYLKNIIDVESSEQILIDDNKYVFIEEGGFSSENITIPQVEIPAPNIEPVTSTIELGEIPGITPKAFDNLEISYPINSILSDFAYATSSVSDYIVSMDKVGVDFRVSIKFEIKGVEDVVNKFTLRNFSLQIPAGLDLSTTNGNYNKKTGILTLLDQKYDSNIIEFSVIINGIDLNESNLEYNHNQHSVNFAGQVGIYSGEIVVSGADFAEGFNILKLPKSIDLVTHFDLSDIVIKTFSGEINYALDGLSIPPVEIGNIPDILGQDETDIVLNNPQIYLQFNNPLAQYNLTAQAGVTITTSRDNLPDQQYTLDNDYFTISGTADNNINTLCLSPAIPDVYYQGYEQATHIPYTSLSYLLSGKGLPKSIAVEITNPTVPTQKVNDFALGQNIGNIQGRYSFYAPLELKSGSKIVFATTVDGWSNENIDAITIKKLDIHANVTNNIPLDIDIFAYPVDVNGNRINDVEIRGFELDANTTNNPLNITLTGEINRFDGIYFEAVATSPEGNSSLNPTEFIHLQDFKITVSGNYITKF